MYISGCTLGGSGGMLPQEILDFRLSVTAPGAFPGSLYRIENCRNTLAISNGGGGRFDQGGKCPPLNEPLNSWCGFGFHV